MLSSKRYCSHEQSLKKKSKSELRLLSKPKHPSNYFCCASSYQQDLKLQNQLRNVVVTDSAVTAFEGSGQIKPLVVIYSL